MERKDLQLQVDGQKLTWILLINWIGLAGLGNLIFLWADEHYRKRAAIATGLSFFSWSLALFFLSPALGVWLPIGMAGWMTIDAIKVYQTCKGKGDKK